MWYLPKIEWYFGKFPNNLNVNTSTAQCTMVFLRYTKHCTKLARTITVDAQICTKFEPIVAWKNIAYQLKCWVLKQRSALCSIWCKERLSPTPSNSLLVRHSSKQPSRCSLTLALKPWTDFSAYKKDEINLFISTIMKSMIIKS